MPKNTQYTQELMTELRDTCLRTGEAVSKIALARGLKQSSVSRAMKKWGVAVPKVAEINEYRAANPTDAPAVAPTETPRETVKRKGKK